MLGQTSKDVVGKPFRPLAAQLGVGDIILEGLQEKTVEFSRRGDSQVMYQMKISSLHDKNGRIVGRVILIYDISEWKRGQKRLTDLATVDFLTGIYNRQHFIYLAQEELFLCAKNHRPCSIILMDVDHFKLVNDNYGHQMGDQVLKHIVNICRNYLRREDIMGRYGGEEFIILLPETQLEGVLLVAERMRLAISQSPHMTSFESIPVSVSLGVAVADVDNFYTLDNLPGQADQVMYVAKNSGRNRVSVYSS